MEYIEILRHLPEHLHAWAVAYGAGLYLILAAVIFAETGLVVTPFLPGDSLLFATGAILAMQIPGLTLPGMCITLMIAAFCGDIVNYHVGQWAAPRLFDGKHLKWLNRKHLQKTKDFYAKHGGKTIILARFLPIVRTYAPFVAGVSGLPLSRFIAYSLFGAAFWIITFLNLGFYFGNIPSVKKNFEYVILAIIIVSVAPVIIELIRNRVRTPTAKVH